MATAEAPGHWVGKKCKWVTPEGETIEGKITGFRLTGSWVEQDGVRYRGVQFHVEHALAKLLPDVPMRTWTNTFPDLSHPIVAGADE